MSIELDKKNEEYGRKDYRIIAKSGTYDGSNLFLKINHNPKTKWTDTFLRFQSGNLGVSRINCFFSDATPFDRAEVFFSTHNENKPLVVGIIAGTHRYYNLSYLKKQTNNILTKTWFPPNQLLDNLIKEHNKVNNVITYRLDKTKKGDSSYDGVKVEREEHPSFEKYKHTPTNSADNTPAYVLYKGHQIELDNRSPFQGKKTKLQTIQKKFYCDVTAYFYKQVKGTQFQNLPIFLVLEENSNSSKYCLQRTDQNGLKWKQIQDPSLDNVITFLIEQRPKQPESYNDSINVTYQTHNSFNVYEHTPEVKHKDKKAYLLYGFQFIERLKNDGYEGVPKLENIQLHKYSKVLVYFFKSETSNFYSEIPIYLELEEEPEQGQTTGSTKYYLQRTDSQSISWKQLNKTDLTNTITFLLEQKKETLYNGSVNVEKNNHISFEIYTHKPNQIDKLGLLLYNSSLIVLNSSKLPDGVEKLGNLEWKNYSEISVYHFKLSSSQIADLPTYLELKVNEAPKGSTESDPSNTKTYYLKPDGSNAIYWSQIPDPKLNEIITFLIDHSPEKGNTYNEASITVNEKTISSFRVITHTPGSKHKDKKGILLYNDQYLQLAPNDLIPPEKKFNEFDGKTYCSVSLFYYNTKDQTLPTFLEVKIKGTGSGSEDQQECTDKSKCYLFQRSDNTGLKWTQVDYQDLRKSVTYQLEWKDERGNGYNGVSVTITRGSEGLFDVYTHTATDKNKMGLLLYQWQTLTLQPNDDTRLTNKLNKLHGNKYCRVCVYYSKSYVSEAPFFLELFENKENDQSYQELDTDSSNSKWLQRVDPEGYHWKQATKPDNFSLETAQQLFQRIKSNDKNSIMVQLPETSRYDMKLIKNYRTDAVGILTKQYKSIFPQTNILSSSNYRYYDHDFSGSRNIDEYNSIDSLKLFIKNIEIKAYNKGGSEQKLEYNPTYDFSKFFFVFFTKNDHVPLLFFYKDKWYRSTKNDFFRKWNEVTDLKERTPNVTDSGGEIKRELNKVYNEFNEILLDNTKEDGYGITVPKGLKPPPGFNTIRVKVKQITAKPPNRNFGKVIHSTNNKSSIGRVMLNGNELKDQSGRRSLLLAFSDEPELSSVIFTSVSAFYHSSDITFHKPLLLEFQKNNTVRSASGNEVFYERQGVTDDTIWKKITGLGDLRDLRSNEGLEKRINSIHYTIGKSIVIQLDQQPDQGGGSGTTNYQVQLVQNGGTEGTPQSSGTIYQVTVSKNGCSQTPLLNYMCFKHTISKLTESEYVSGLRLYVCDKYLETHTGSAPLPIYYNPEKKDVKVYFYQGSSNNPDKVPLLVQYEETYFKPSSRDSYFNSWVKVDVSATDPPRGDLGQLPQIGKVLEEINKELNTIQLEKNNNESYGLQKPTGPPEVSTCGNGTKIDTFCNRVTVTRDGHSHKDYYLKVTHTTNNKGPIGYFYTGKTKINKIKIEDDAKTCNQVNVYYLKTDSNYQSPLLVCITTEGTESTPGCTKTWFSRIGIKPTDWNNADNKDDKYGDDTKIKHELEKIQANLSNYLNLDIYKQGEYSGCVQKGSEDSGKKEAGRISVSAEYSQNTYKVDSYRIYQHYLSSYYIGSKQKIQEALSLQEQGNDLNLQVRIYIDSIYINILGTNNQTLSTPLTYGQTQESGGTHYDPYVYFYEPDTYGSGYKTDTVPLLFKYGDKFFGPSSKEKYFENWKEVTIENGGKMAKNLKKELDRINGELNEVDLSKKGGDGERAYGLEKPDDNTGLDNFKTKRITVKNEVKQGSGTTFYTYVTHSTANKYNIGNIKELSKSCTFDNNHSEKLGTTLHNEAVAVYDGGDTRYEHPKLVLVAESKGSGLGGDKSTVLGYYDLTNGGKGKCVSSGNITFKRITETFKLEEITKKEKMTGENELIKVLDTIGIFPKEQKPAAPLSHLSTESASTEALGLGGHTSLRSDRDEGQDGRPKASLGGGGDRRVGSGGRGADAEAEPGAPGKNGETGPQVSRGDSSVLGGDVPGQTGESVGRGTPEVSRTQTEATTPTSNHGTSSRNGLDGHQHTTGGVGNVEENRGGASPDSPEAGRPDSLTRQDSTAQGTGISPASPRKPGQNGQKKVEEAPSPQGKNGDTGAPEAAKKSYSYTGDDTIDEIIHKIVKAAEDHPAEFYGGTGSVGGVGVMATVGAVVYKKCVIGKTTNDSAIYIRQVTLSYTSI